MIFLYVSKEAKEGIIIVKGVSFIFASPNFLLGDCI